VPYQARGTTSPSGGADRYGADTKLVEMPISWSLDDFPVFEYMRYQNLIQPA
jgi:hypothetical protein